MFKKSLLVAIALLCGMLYGAILQPVKAAETFPDVPKSHWAYNTIQWAVENSVVNGYPDGTFRPSQQVTEAEFLVMFIRAFEQLPNVTKINHWADPAYKFADEKNWPTMGSNNYELRGKAISRGQVAEIIAGAKGVNFLGRDAIQYLLNTNLSKGKTDATVEGYKGSDYLTRAEAVQFIKNLKDAGMTELLARPVLPTPISQMPQPQTPQQPGQDDANLPPDIRNIKNKMEQVVKNYPGYTVGGSSEGITIVKGEWKSKNASVTYNKATTDGGLDRVISFKATQDESIRLTVEMLKAVGVPVQDSFFDTLKSAAKTGKESRPKVGNYELIVSPHPTNADHMTIYIKK